MSDSYYRDAQKKAQREFRACIYQGKHPYLTRLDEFLPPEQLSGGVDLGLVLISLEQVAGTVTCGRTRAFARNFMPLLPEKSEFADKWSRLCNAHLEEGIRDPVKVVEYMNRFYVEEGNKRVSVLKFFGAVNVQARVRRILPQRNGTKEVELYYEFLDFYRYAGINFLEFSRSGSYQELQKLLGKAPGEVWPEEERNRFGAIYYYFRKAYESAGGKRLNSTVGDALLAYIRVYGYADLRGKTEAEIKKSVEKVWEDITLQQENAPIDVKLKPEDKGGNLLSRVIPKITKAAFVHDKDPRYSGWLYGHEQGRLYAERALGGEVETSAYFGSPTGDPREVIECAVEDGNTVIFTTSPRLLNASLRAAVDHPELTILNCSLNASHRYIRTYYARMYEVKFIAGAIAGSLAGNSHVGYICDYPIFGQVAGINAFALGVQLTNPAARVFLEWSSVQDGERPADSSCGLDGACGADRADRNGPDETAGTGGGASIQGGRVTDDTIQSPPPPPRPGITAATKRLTDRGVRLISSLDLVTPGSTERGGMGLTLASGDGQVLLAVPQWKWGVYYEKIFRQIRDGTFRTEYKESSRALNYYWGLSAGVVDLLCTDKLPESSRRLADILLESVCSGACDPFKGPLFGQDGHRIPEPEEGFGVEQIINMTWLNENVSGSLPEYGQLDDTGKSTVDVMGVEPSKKEPAGTA